MGPIANLLGMMPGMGQMKDQLAELDDRHFDRVTAIIRSMTPQERANPKIINGSRRARIAGGSGVTVMDVNQLLNRFAEAQKMMKQMGGMMGLPGVGRRKATKSPKNKRKGTQGRPAARAGRGGAGRMPRHARPASCRRCMGATSCLVDRLRATQLDFGGLRQQDRPTTARPFRRRTDRHDDLR